MIINFEKLFCAEFFDSNRIKEEADQFGGASVTKFLTEDFHRVLLEEATAANYEVQPEYVSGVKQDLELCRLGEADEDVPRQDDYANIYALRDAYQRLLKETKWRFLTELQLNSIYLQRYRPGSYGISPHRDDERFINLISVFTLSGDARFYLCNDKTGSSPRELDASPGSLIVLRAPGFLGKNLTRPYHYLSGPVGSVRHSVTLRQI